MELWRQFLAKKSLARMRKFETQARSQPIWPFWSKFDQFWPENWDPGPKALKEQITAKRFTIPGYHQSPSDAKKGLLKALFELFRQPIIETRRP